MNMKIHFCILVSLFISRCLCMKIRKCCKQGQQLNATTVCVDSPTNDTDDWIPRDSFIIHSSKSTVKISSERVLKTIKEIYTGKLDIGFPKCDRSWRDLALAWKDRELKNQFYLAYDIDKTVKLNLNRESIYHTNVTLSFSKEFPPNTYCIDKGPHDSYVVVICPCSEITCIRKCCHQYAVFDEDANKCVHMDSLNLTDEQYDMYKDWRPQFEASSFDDEDDPDEVEYFLLAGKLPPCLADRQVFTDRPTDSKPLLFLPDGKLRLNDSDGSTAPPGDHCGELGWRNATRQLQSLLLRCFSAKSDQTHKEAQTRASSYVILLAVSAVPLFCAAFCIAFGGDLEERRGARPALAHVACLAVAHVAAAVAQSPIGVNGPWCVGFGYLMQFSFLAAFFWLNAMCVDMSWTFSGVRAPSGSRADRDRRRFIWYSLYAWGGAATLTVAALAVDYSPGVPLSSPYKPNLGAVKCWFNTSQSVLLYFYGPMGLLLLANLGFFIYTSWKIVILRRGAGALNQEDSARHGGSRSPSNKERQKFVLYGKLFSLMGITWLTEIISWAVGGPTYIWYFTDSINLLRAVFIFIIFCWKPKVWAAVKKRMACFRSCTKVSAGMKKNSTTDPSSSSTNCNKSTSRTDCVEMEHK